MPRERIRSQNKVRGDRNERHPRVFLEEKQGGKNERKAESNLQEMFPELAKEDEKVLWSRFQELIIFRYNN